MILQARATREASSVMPALLPELIQDFVSPLGLSVDGARGVECAFIPK
jgi:hypothetical protein